MQVSATTQILRPNRLKTLGWLALSATLTIGGIWMIVAGKPIGWLPALFFGLCVIVFALILLPNSSYLRLEPDGFTICSLFRAHSFRWEDVGPFTVNRVGPNRMVVFNFSDEYRDSPLARKVSSALGGHEGGLPDSYGLSLEDLADLLNKYRVLKSVD